MKSKSPARGIVWGQNTDQSGCGPTTLQKLKPGHRNESIAFFSSATSLSDGKKSVLLPVECTEDAPYEDEALLDWVRKARRLTEFCILSIANKQLSFFRFLRSAIRPALQGAYFCLRKVDVRTVHFVGKYYTAFYSVRDTFLELLSIFVANMIPESSRSSVEKKATGCASGKIDMSFFSSKKVKIMYRGFVVLLGWADALTLSTMVFVEHKASSMFPTESPSDQLHFIPAILPGEGGFCAEENRTLLIPTVNAGVAVVNKSSIDESIGRYSSTTRILQDYVKEHGARVWDAKRIALLNVWLGPIAALFKLDGA